jgi:hypothetical protein
LADTSPKVREFFLSSRWCINLTEEAALDKENEEGGRDCS